MTTLTELRAAVRRLARRPLLATFAIATIALGVGVNTAVFSLVEAVILRPLPLDAPDRLMVVEQSDDERHQERLGFATFLDLEARSTSFEALAVMSFWQPLLAGDGDAETLAAVRGSARIFDALGVRPLLGRSFTADEARPGAPRVVLLGHGFWQRRYAGDPAIVGRTIELSGLPHEVVGVLPPGIDGLLRAGVGQNRSLDLLGPLRYSVDLPYACRSCQHLGGIGRLRPGVSRVAAQQELDALFAGLEREHPADYPRAAGLVTPFSERLTERARPLLVTLQAGAFAVALLAAINLAALLAARAIERERELGVARALGVGLPRLLFSAWSEALVLVAAGAAAGALAARPLVALLVAFAPDSLVRLEGIRPSPLIFGAALALVALSALVAGVAPALVALRSSPRSLVSGSAGSSAGRRQLRLVETIAVAETAAALVLVFAAGLLGRSLERLNAEPSGLEPKGVLVADVAVTGSAYEESDAVHRFYERTLESITAIPGVAAAGYTHQIPFGGNFDRYGAQFEDRPDLTGADTLAITRYGVTPGYFRAVGVRLVSGRLLDERDRANSERVVVIDRALAETVWPDRDPIGRRLRVGGDEGPWRSVVGVVESVRHVGLDSRDPGQFYVPERQWLFADSERVLAVRADGDALRLAPAIRAAIASVEPRAAVERMAPLAALVANSTAPRRYALSLWSMFGALALVLAATGTFGVLARLVALRRRELALRSSLGATPRSLAARVARRATLLLAAATVLAVPGALAVGRLLAAQLWQVDATDAGTGIVATLCLALVVALATFGPARTAARVDPVTALRSE